MRISLIIALITSTTLNFIIAAPVKAQPNLQAHLKISLANESLKSALKKIEEHTNLRFVYRAEEIASLRVAALPQTDRTVEHTLHLLLDPNGLVFKTINNSILITKGTSPVKSDNEVSKEASQQAIQINGIVRDEEAKPISGVTILSKEDRNSSTATDENGHFHINLKGRDVLTFSHIGYKSQQINVTQSTSLEVVLQASLGSLNEVQIIGYGTTTKKLNTGAVSSITSQDIENQPVSNPLAAIQGKLAGVQITSNNGLPGAGYRVQIRGVGSINSGTLPLYVIDGVPFTLFNGSAPPSDGLNAFGISGAVGGETSPLGLINPDDIERIDVLKDADATAIYGSKGANGVILITTKKGKAGNTKITANFYTGAAKVAKFLDLLNTADYLNLRKQAFANANQTPTTTNAPDLLVWDQNAYTDWQRYFIGGTAHSTNADLSVSGGSSNNTFLFTSNYRHDGTVYPGDFGSNLFSNRLNAGHKSANNKFGINLNVNYTYQKYSIPGTDLTQLYNLPPNLPIYNPDGTLYWNTSITNPQSYLYIKNYNAATNFISNMDVHYNLSPELKVKANLGYSLTGLQQTLQTPSTAINPAFFSAAAPTNSTQYANNTNSNYIIEPQLQYTKQLAKGNLDVLIGSTFQNTINDGVNLLGTGFSSDALLGSFYNAASIINYGGNNSDYKYTAGFGRINYNWQGKYLIDATFRRDGSSRFGPDHRFGNFWAVGAAWIFTQEKWLSDLNWLSFGKLRGSYGLTGNDQISNYQYDAYYNAIGSSRSYQGQTILYPSNIPNPNLHWETNKKLDFGLELGFLKDRIYFKTDVYRNRSSDQLLYLVLPSAAGINGYTGNFPAVVQNSGVEFELNTINVQTSDLKWTTSINLTFQRNVIKSIENPSQLFNSYIVGQPVNIPLLFHFTGINPATGAPTFQDLNGDGTVNFSDRNPAPQGHPYYGGLTNMITYKKVSLNFTVQFNHRNGYINNSSSYPYGSSLVNQNVTALSRWVQPGDNSIYPGATTISSSPYSYYNSSDANWGDASFIKLKNVSLSYLLPNSWVRSVKLSSVNVFARGENLWFWARQKYTYDPETTVSGAAPGLGTGQYIALPQLRTIVFGLNCSF